MNKKKEIVSIKNKSFMTLFNFLARGISLKSFLKIWNLEFFYYFILYKFSICDKL